MTYYLLFALGYGVGYDDAPAPPAPTAETVLYTSAGYWANEV